MLALALALAMAFGSDVGSIKGRVVDADTREAVEGAAVEVDGTELGATTSEDGTFQIDNVAPGSQRVLVSAVGYKPVAETVAVAPGTTVSLKFRLSITGFIHGPDESADTFGSVSGRVTDDSTGESIADAFVEAPGADLAVVSDLSGAYSFGEFPRGYQRFRVRAVGYEDVVRDSVRCEWFSKTVDFRMRRVGGAQSAEARRAIEREVSRSVLPRPKGPPPPVAWVRTFEGIGEAYGYSVKSTSDGGYVIAGSTFDTSRGWCAYLVKTDSLGVAAWERVLPGRGGEFDEVQQTRDGGYVACGSVHGANPITKFDTSGSVQWQKDVPADGDASLHSIQQTSDDGYIVGGDRIGSWVAKLDSAGTVLWSRDCGESPPWELDYTSVRQIRGEGYVAAAENDSHGTRLMGLDRCGGVTWTRILKGNMAVRPSYRIEPTQDGGFIIAGPSAWDRRRQIYSFASLTRFSSNGRVVWRKLFSQKNVNEFYSVAVTRDGGFLAAGVTSPVCDMHFEYDPDGGEIQRGYVVAVDSRGNLKWATCVGPSSVYNDAQCVAETRDGGCVVTGTQTDWRGNNSRMYLLKLVPASKR